MCNPTRDGNGSGLNGDPLRPAPIRSEFSSELTGVGAGMDFLEHDLSWVGAGLTFGWVLDLPRPTSYIFLIYSSVYTSL